ncbi:PIN domain-containing protein [Candidatus Bathyarchaeota archaeon]|nr:PIN domain-containing protein [Candidatus Bathyarchaeota archaeon]
MNERYIIDAYAWIEYLTGSSAGDKVNHILGENRNLIYTCAVTIAEVVSKTAREGRDPEAAYNILTCNSNTINVNHELSKDAGTLHAEIRKTIRDFGLADAYVLASARKLNAKILTGDPHFKSFKEAILL